MDGQRYADTEFGSVRPTGGRHGYLAYFRKPIPRRVAISEANLFRLTGAQASLIEVFDAEASDQPYNADIEEVVHYVNAMEAGTNAVTRRLREATAVASGPRSLGGSTRLAMLPCRRPGRR
jgi:hypothetical protein